jgi:hypothetical protein
MEGKWIVHSREEQFCRLKGDQPSSYSKTMVTRREEY